LEVTTVGILVMNYSFTHNNKKPLNWVGAASPWAKSSARPRFGSSRTSRLG
jgi:hypothetical protein